MKGLGLAYLKFHVCSRLGVVCLECAEVLAISFESPGSHSASNILSSTSVIDF